MKKTLITPLLTLLVVSCGTPLPSFESSVSSLLSSQDESSIISQITSSSSIVSSSSSTSSSTTSSIQSTSSSSTASSNQSTSSSSSSTSTSSSTSSTTSEPPLNTRKVPFNQIGSLVAQVVDAKAMGVVNSKDRPQVSGRKKAQEEDQNYMVKVTETYNPNSEITEDQTVQVTFSRVTNTQTTELQTGSETYVATAEALEIERVTDLPGNIVITNVEGYEFRLMSGEVVVQDWISSELETIEFIFDQALTGINLESRSLNASISFIAFEGFTYTLKQGETVIYEDLEDNDDADNNEALGAINLSGLTEGLTYEVTYEGYQVIETITQDEVEGQVDKLYVLYQYTFISFVPLNLNQRPQDQDLELDYDDVPLYDKQGFFSDSTRQSFVVDNETGLIYKIENINIANLSGGCVTVKDNQFPFDMRVTELGELDFYSIYQNAAISNSGCFKDKFGNKFIMNNAVALTDSSTSTTYYIQNQRIRYFLTSDGLVLKLDTHVPYLSKIVENNIERSIKRSDNFEIFPATEVNTFQSVFHSVINGVIKAVPNRGWDGGYSYYGNFDAVDGTANRMELSSFSGINSYRSDLLLDYDLLLHWYDGDLFEIRSFSKKMENFFDLYSEGNYYWPVSDGLDGGALSQYDEEQRFARLHRIELYESFEAKKLLSDVTINGTNSFTKIELSGNVNYELVLNKFENEYGLVPYVSGTYIAPPSITITLQPINK